MDTLKFNNNNNYFIISHVNQVQTNAVVQFWLMFPKIYYTVKTTIYISMYKFPKMNLFSKGTPYDFFSQQVLRNFKFYQTFQPRPSQKSKKFFSKSFTPVKKQFFYQFDVL